jgi:hypothetical protein
MRRVLRYLAISLLITSPAALQADEHWDVSDEYVATSSWQAGFDMVFARPHFENNVAYTVMQSDGVSFESISETEFDYDHVLTPRIWLGYQTPEGVGLRASYWEFDQGAVAPTVNPPANGFGDVTHPAFGGVDISSNVPTDTFSARSGLDAYTLDLEMLLCGELCNWQLLTSAGVRYASISQDYLAQLRNGAGTLVGEIDYQHATDGFGPTMAVQAKRPLFGGLSFVGLARGSLLFDDSRSQLRAGEDLDLVTPFITTRSTVRNDLLPIGELQVGSEWSSGQLSYGEVIVRSTLEGQLWSGVGNATSESGDLGFIGYSIGVGLKR